MRVKRQRRLRRLVPDRELFRRRAAGETLRALASDYGVRHTTLGRYFSRPESRRQLKQAGQLVRAERYRRLRRLVPDPELFRRRAAGETLRALAPDYGVRHTTLGRYFSRPQARRQLRQAGQLVRAERRAAQARRRDERRFEQQVRRKANEQAALEREQARRDRAARAKMGASENLCMRFSFVVLVGLGSGRGRLRGIRTSRPSGVSSCSRGF